MYIIYFLKNEKFSIILYFHYLYKATCQVFRNRYLLFIPGKCILRFFMDFVQKRTKLSQPAYSLNGIDRLSVGFKFIELFPLINYYKKISIPPFKIKRIGKVSHRRVAKADKCTIFSTPLRGKSTITKQFSKNRKLFLTF